MNNVIDNRTALPPVLYIYTVCIIYMHSFNAFMQYITHTYTDIHLNYFLMMSLHFSQNKVILLS